LIWVHFLSIEIKQAYHYTDLIFKKYFNIFLSRQN